VNKYVTHMVSVLLVVCLFADPATVWAMQGAFHANTSSEIPQIAIQDHPRFNEQALTLALVAVGFGTHGFHQQAALYVQHLTTMAARADGSHSSLWLGSFFLSAIVLANGARSSYLSTIIQKLFEWQNILNKLTIFDLPESHLGALTGKEAVEFHDLNKLLDDAYKAISAWQTEWVRRRHPDLAELIRELKNIFPEKIDVTSPLQVIALGKTFLGTLNAKLTSRDLKVDTKRAQPSPGGAPTPVGAREGPGRLADEPPSQVANRTEEFMAIRRANRVRFAFSWTEQSATQVILLAAGDYPVGRYLRMLLLKCAHRISMKPALFKRDPMTALEAARGTLEHPALTKAQKAALDSFGSQNQNAASLKPLIEKLRRERPLTAQEKNEVGAALIRASLTLNEKTTVGIALHLNGLSQSQREKMLQRIESASKKVLKATSEHRKITGFGLLESDSKPHAKQPTAVAPRTWYGSLMRWAVDRINNTPNKSHDWLSLIIFAIALGVAPFIEPWTLFWNVKIYGEGNTRLLEAHREAFVKTEDGLIILRMLTEHELDALSKAAFKIFQPFYNRHAFDGSTVLWGYAVSVSRHMRYNWKVLRQDKDTPPGTALAVAGMGVGRSKSKDAPSEFKVGDRVLVTSVQELGIVDWVDNSTRSVILKGKPFKYSFDSLKRVADISPPPQVSGRTATGAPLGWLMPDIVRTARTEKQIYERFDTSIEDMVDQSMSDRGLTAKDVWPNQSLTPRRISPSTIFDRLYDFGVSRVRKLVDLESHNGLVGLIGSMLNAEVVSVEPKRFTPLRLLIQQRLTLHNFRIQENRLNFVDQKFIQKKFIREALKKVDIVFLDGTMTDPAHALELENLLQKSLRLGGIAWFYGFNPVGPLLNKDEWIPHLLRSGISKFDQAYYRLHVKKSQHRRWFFDLGGSGGSSMFAWDALSFLVLVNLSLHLNVPHALALALMAIPLLFLAALMGGGGKPGPAEEEMAGQFLRTLSSQDRDFFGWDVATGVNPKRLARFQEALNNFLMAQPQLARRVAWRVEKMVYRMSVIWALRNYRRDIRMSLADAFKSSADWRITLSRFLVQPQPYPPQNVIYIGPDDIDSKVWLDERHSPIRVGFHRFGFDSPFPKLATGEADWIFFLFPSKRLLVDQQRRIALSVARGLKPGGEFVAIFSGQSHIPASGLAIHLLKIGGLEVVFEELPRQRLKGGEPLQIIEETRSVIELRELFDLRYAQDEGKYQAKMGILLPETVILLHARKLASPEPTTPINAPTPGPQTESLDRAA
jgi:hypothetical protein